MIPTACHMPDISDECQPLTPNLFLIVNFKGDGALTRETALSRREMVRLVDKAIREYTAARKYLLAQMEEKGSGVFHIFGFVDCLENCLNACRRLSYFLEQVKGVPVVKLSHRTIKADSAEIKDVRDTLEHMAEKIAQGVIQDGHPIFLCPTQDGRAFSLGEYTLQFERLAFVLKIFHKVADHLIELTNH